MIFHKAIAAVFGIGYLPKGGGSVAAAAYCFLWISIPYHSGVAELFLALAVTIIGVISASEVEKDWGTDSSKVVIDEVAGMMVSLLFIPPAIIHVIIAFILFRFFDIVKPLGIRKSEQFPSGWGVMADDILSGICALIILKTSIAVNLI